MRPSTVIQAWQTWWRKWHTILDRIWGMLCFTRDVMHLAKTDICACVFRRDWRYYQCLKEDTHQTCGAANGNSTATLWLYKECFLEKKLCETTKCFSDYIEKFVKMIRLSPALTWGAHRELNDSQTWKKTPWNLWGNTTLMLKSVYARRVYKSQRAVWRMFIEISYLLNPSILIVILIKIG